MSAVDVRPAPLTVSRAQLMRLPADASRRILLEMARRQDEARERAAALDAERLALAEADRKRALAAEIAVIVEQAEAVREADRRAGVERGRWALPCSVCDTWPPHDLRRCKACGRP